MIDILMATYNGETYLREQLASIEAQSCRHWRLIVHDDGSTDGTWQILEKFQQKLGSEKVVLKKNEPPSGGAKYNFMGLLKAAAASYVMLCDQDDVWHEDKLAITLHRMKQLEKRYGTDQPFLVHTDLIVADEHLKEIHPAFHKYMDLRTDGRLRYELIQNQVTGCTVMINRPLQQLAKDVSALDAIVMHDHWLALIALVFGKLSYINRSTIDYRQHGDNSVGAQNAKSIGYMYARFKRGRRKFRQDMVDSAMQARLFLTEYGDCIESEKVLNLLQNYAFLYEKGKLARIRLFFRYGYWKKGVIRKIMQIIWG